jgi:hypothetical protein
MCGGEVLQIAVPIPQGTGSNLTIVDTNIVFLDIIHRPVFI